MDEILTVAGRAGLGKMILTALVTVLGLGCAAADTETSSDLSTAGQAPSSEGTLGANDANNSTGGLDESIEKGLRDDFCCVVKFDGKHVDTCYDYHKTKAWATTKCNVAAALDGFPAILREGKCSDYGSCKGLIGPCFSGNQEIPCSSR